MNLPSSSTAPLSAARKTELLQGSYPYIYQSVNGVDLTAYCFYPEGNHPNQPSAELKPAIVFFHGGLWDVSMVTQFSPHAMHFASRGMVAVVVEYRVDAINQSSPDDSFEDAQMAMLWLRHNHADMGVDPNRIIVAGAACGAHMALSLAMRKKLEEVEGYNVRPQAVIAISAIVHTSRRILNPRHFPNARHATKNNPSTNIRRKLVPSLFVHGKADTIAPYYLIADFVKAMKRKRNHCELIDFDACNHSFFNFNISSKHFEITLNTMDAFVSNLGYISETEYQ